MVLSIVRWWQALLAYHRDRWAVRQRRIDIQILWPSICKSAWSADQARFAFLMHCESDPAWSLLGRDKVKEIVDGLNFEEHQGDQDYAKH